MNKTPVYLISAPIGSYLSDMALASLQQIRATTHLFIESRGRFIMKLTSKGYITDKHTLIPLDGDSLAIARKLLASKNSFAILADTGNPCFVDPGYDIVRHILDECLDQVTLVPLGMSSALDAALSMAGLDIQKFVFCGHFPENHLERPPSTGVPLVYYVAGGGVFEWSRLVATASNWKTITLFRNIRDRDGGQIYRWKNGDVLTPPQNDSNDNYVGIINLVGWDD